MITVHHHFMCFTKQNKDLNRKNLNKKGKFSSFQIFYAIIDQRGNAWAQL